MGNPTALIICTTRLCLCFSLDTLHAMSHVSGSASGDGSGGGDGARESGGGKDAWTKITFKKRVKSNKNRTSDSQSEVVDEPLVKTFRNAKDGKSVTVGCIKDGKRVLYGSEENKYCCICRADRDHLVASLSRIFSAISVMNTVIGLRFVPLS